MVQECIVLLIVFNESHIHKYEIILPTPIPSETGYNPFRLVYVYIYNTVILMDIDEHEAPITIL